MDKEPVKTIAFVSVAKTIAQLMAVLLFVAVIIFSSIELFWIHSNAKKINDGKISLEDIHESIQLLENCKKSKVETRQCEDISSSSIDQINQKLESINGALRIEDMLALLAIFITISSVLIPVIVFINLKSEKSDLEKQLNDKLSYAEANIKNEIFTNPRIEDRLIQEIQEKMNKFMHIIRMARLDYLKAQSAESFADAQKLSYDIERGLVLLISGKHKDIEDGFKILNSIFNHENISQIRKTVQQIKRLGYLSSSDKDYLYKKFMGDA